MATPVVAGLLGFDEVSKPRYDKYTTNKLFIQFC